MRILSGLALATVLNLPFAHAREVVEPQLGHCWENGCYSTVTAPFCTKAAKPRTAQWLKVMPAGFRSRLNVRAVIQPGEAPLVVLLNGTFAKADGPMTELWANWLESQGCHVLTFDSPLLASFAKASMNGVGGNPVVEAEVCGRVIEAFLKERLPGKVSKIGIVGMSYGGLMALQLNKLELAGKLSFKIDAIQAYSPPAKYQRAIELLDQYFTFDWKLSDHYWKFNNLQRTKQMPEFDQHMMEAAISRVFRMDLMYAIEAHDDLFNVELDKYKVVRFDIPKRDGFIGSEDRVIHTENINFETYMEQMAIPYWVGKGQVASEAEFYHGADLAYLMESAGARVELILAKNDPLNDSNAAEPFLKFDGPSNVTLLQQGGHLGYCDSPWVKQNLAEMFSPKPIAAVKTEVKTVTPGPVIVETENSPAVIKAGQPILQTNYGDK